MFGNLKDFESLLGGVERNSSGHIVKAKAILNYWYLTVNLTAIDMDKTGNLAGTADFVGILLFSIAMDYILWNY